MSYEEIFLELLRLNAETHQMQLELFENMIAQKNNDEGNQ